MIHQGIPLKGSFKHKCHVSHSGSLLWYQCNTIQCLSFLNFRFWIFYETSAFFERGMGHLVRLVHHLLLLLHPGLITSQVMVMRMRMRIKMRRRKIMMMMIFVVLIAQLGLSVTRVGLRTNWNHVDQNCNRILGFWSSLT